MQSLDNTSQLTREQVFSTERVLCEKRDKLFATRRTYMSIMESVRDEMIKLDIDIESLQESIDEIAEKRRDIEARDTDFYQNELRSRFHAHLDKLTTITPYEKATIEALFVFSNSRSTGLAGRIFMEQDMYMGPSDPPHVRLTCGIYGDTEKFSTFARKVGAKVHQGCMGNFISLPEEEMFYYIVKNHAILTYE